ncbi:alpha/beta hydrolase [Falsiroseomonas tokyonensis]|uniref:Alpha/beta hydrolase n=1 Tax=Falsiroseomonas tokyonensis TaxID=430521 RepID=A0ABV7BWY5_9PROT|nr:alpha/beta hydrolase [Falsiroseomonas tokyonensis]MBU8540132.1 alpha/beta hydrolase [Falsiroseomonas tokyonensis]
MLDRRGLIALGALAALPRAARAQTIFELPDPAGLRVFLHRPANWRPDGRAIIVLHGLRRDADRYLAEWAPQAEAANLLLVAPEFSRALFPTVASYNWGNVVSEDLRPNAPEAWTFGLIDRIWDAVRARTGAVRAGYTLFGHSAGAQFVHRYLLLAEASRAEAIITANAGSYTMPVRDVAFPFGLGGLDVPEARLQAAFARPVTVLLGADDADPRHPSLPRQPGAIAQGPHRLARGLNFYATARAEAWRLEMPFRWRLETVPGVGHDNGGMARRAAEIAVSAAG